MQYSRFYTVMADGTIKQVNPFTNTEVWAVPGRSGKPVSNQIAEEHASIDQDSMESFCSFCPTRLFETPPEKSRLVLTQDTYSELTHVPPEEYDNTHWVFRRVPNLFEIVTVDYWKKNYAYALTKKNSDWKHAYLSSEVGAQHVHDILNYKLRATGNTEERIAKLTNDERASMADAFFGGSHELIIARPHFTSDAQTDGDLFSSGSMTTEEHFQYFKFTVDAMRDIYESNHYLRYISVFQNWLAPAGASFDHLHKQLVGLDEWGSSIRHQIEMLMQDRNVFNQYGINLAAMHNLVFAENDKAVAFVGIGHRHPTLEIFSKSYFSRPYEHSDDEIRAVSDLVHACHAAMGHEISCNEEWYYTPLDAVYKMPWHILIKWRINTTAGFEGGTSIYINPITPLELRDRMVPNLYRLRDSGRIATNIRIAEECEVAPNPLRYYLE